MHTSWSSRVRLKEKKHGKIVGEWIEEVYSSKQCWNSAWNKVARKDWHKILPISIKSFTMGSHYITWLLGKFKRRTLSLWTRNCIIFQIHSEKPLLTLGLMFIKKRSFPIGFWAVHHPGKPVDWTKDCKVRGSWSMKIKSDDLLPALLDN